MTGPGKGRLALAARLFAGGLVAKVGAVAITVALLYGLMRLERLFLAHASAAAAAWYRQYDAAIDLSLIALIIAAAYGVYRLVSSRRQ